MKAIELEENRIYIGKPLDIIAELESWVSAEFEMYYLNDIKESMHLEFAHNWIQKAEYIVDWIKEHGENNVIVVDIGEDYRTTIELTPVSIRELSQKDNFYDDLEKMDDFRCLTKDEFLQSYSYLTEEEYNNTLVIDAYLSLIAKETRNG